MGAGAALLASLLEAVTIAFLDPLLKQLFGTGLGEGSSRLERLIPRLLDPFLSGAEPDQITMRLVMLFLAAMLVKICAGYLSAYCSVLAQEGVARDLRVRLWDHLMKLDLAVFQRTRGGQVASSVVSDADQVKQVVVAALPAFFQNLVMILALVTVMLLTSWRLTLMVLVLAPLLVIVVQLLRTRLKRHARAFAHERGELTATVTERLGAIKLIRAFGAERHEQENFARQADRYRKGVVRTQRFALLTSPASELFEAIRATMPAETPGSLTDAQYLDVTSYILQTGNARAPEGNVSEAGLAALTIAPAATNPGGTDSSDWEHFNGNLQAATVDTQAFFQTR